MNVGSASAGDSHCEAFPEEANGEASANDPAGANLCYTGDRQP